MEVEKTEKKKTYGAEFRERVGILVLERTRDSEEVGVWGGVMSKSK